MKTIMTTATLALLLTTAPVMARGGGGHGGGRSSSSHSSRSSGSEHYTAAHVTKNGTFVQGHYSTNPNGTRNDNYSTRGNVNPHTGEEGTKPRDESPQ